MATRSESKKQGIFSIFNAALLAVLAVATSVLLCACSATDTQSASSAASSSSATSAAVSSSSAAAEVPASVEENDVTITVTSPEGPDAIDFTQVLGVAEGATVLDALQATELDVTVVDGPYGAYVEAIGNIANEGTTGWTYTVNGEKLQVSAGLAVVNAGDTIEWSYTDAAE